MNVVPPSNKNTTISHCPCCGYHRSRSLVSLGHISEAFLKTCNPRFQRSALSLGTTHSKQPLLRLMEVFPSSEQLPTAPDIQRLPNAIQRVSFLQSENEVSLVFCGEKWVLKMDVHFHARLLQHFSSDKSQSYSYMGKCFSGQAAPTLANIYQTPSSLGPKANFPMSSWSPTSHAQTLSPQIFAIISRILQWNGRFQWPSWASSNRIIADHGSIALVLRFLPPACLLNLSSFLVPGHFQESCSVPPHEHRNAGPRWLELVQFWHLGEG